MTYKTEPYFLPSHDGVSRCFGLSVIPEAPWAMLEISHGMAEHMGRYRAFMEALAAEGILCFGHDHAGHGGSVSDAKDLGYLPRKTGAQTLICDVIADAARMRAAYPGLPLILLGHSMGSFIARLAVTEEDFACDLLILSGTGGRNALAGVGMMLQSLLCRLNGERSYSAFIENLMFGTYNDRFEKRSAFDWLTTDTDAVDAYLADPLSGYPFTVSALYVLTALTKRANSAGTFRKTPKTLPVFLLSGGDDPVGSFGRGVRQTADAYLRAGVSQTSVSLYPGARHELLNEPVHGQVTEDLLACIHTHIPQQ